MYCIYCGKELKENEVCSCRMGLPVEPDMEAPTEETPPRRRQDEPNQTAEQVKQTAAKVQQRLAHGAKAAADAVQSSGAVQHSKNLLLNLMEEPIDGLNAAYRSRQKLAQYCFGGLYLFVWFLLGAAMFRDFMSLISSSAGFGGTVAFGITIAVIAALVQLIYCICFNLFSDKTQRFRGVCATVGAGLWPETMVALLLFLCMMIFGWSSYMLLLFLMLLMTTLDLMSHYTAAVAVCGKKKAFYVCLGAVVVVNILLLLLVRSAMSDALEQLEDAIQNMMYYSIYY